MTIETTLAVINIVVSTVLAIALFYIGSKTNKIDSLEKKLEEAAQKLIDSKLTMHSTEMRSAINLLQSMLGNVEGQVKQGDQELDSQGKEKQKLELTTNAKISDLKTWVVEHCATKADVSTLTKEVTDLRVSVALAMNGRSLPHSAGGII